MTIWVIALLCNKYCGNQFCWTEALKWGCAIRAIGILTSSAPLLYMANGPKYFWGSRPNATNGTGRILPIHNGEV